MTGPQTIDINAVLAASNSLSTNPPPSDPPPAFQVPQPIQPVPTDDDLRRRNRKASMFKKGHLVDSQEKRIGRGRLFSIGLAGATIRRDDTIEKTPIRNTRSRDTKCNLINITGDAFTHEAFVYDRIKLRMGRHTEGLERLADQVSGILMPDAEVPALRTFKFQDMRGGNLREYIQRNEPLLVRDVVMRAIEAARGLIQLHEMKMIMGDFGTEDFWLGAGGVLRISEFSRTLVYPADTDLSRLERDLNHGHAPVGPSRLTDIGQLGAVFYELEAGRPVDFDLVMAGDVATFPPRDHLPITVDLHLNQIIHRAWTGDYRNPEALMGDLTALQRQIDQDDPNGTLRAYRPAGSVGRVWHWMKSVARCFRDSMPWFGRNRRNSR